MSDERLAERTTGGIVADLAVEHDHQFAELTGRRKLGYDAARLPAELSVAAGRPARPAISSVAAGGHAMFRTASQAAAAGLTRAFLGVASHRALPRAAHASGAALAIRNAVLTIMSCAANTARAARAVDTTADGSRLAAAARFRARTRLEPSTSGCRATRGRRSTSARLSARAGFRRGPGITARRCTRIVAATARVLARFAAVCGRARGSAAVRQWTITHRGCWTIRTRTRRADPQGCQENAREPTNQVTA